MLRSLSFPSGLPIESVLDEVRRALSGGRAALLQAAPGAGKTTIVPLAMLDEPWLAGARIVMLEPRRLAARAAARRMAALLGEPVGRTVGYRMRMETVVSRDTRIEVVTEGVLTRMLQGDPALEGTGLVIFDEFHERSLNADLGLALTLQAQAVLRPDLRILVMSATLDHQRVAGLLGGDAPTIASEGRTYPVELRYLGRDAAERIESAAARAVRRALGDGARGVLVFLPGAGEIRRTAEYLADLVGSDVDLAPLHGTLEQEAQDRAIAPPVAGRRKVVLATSIAETSLTIEGITAVVDAGLLRVPRFSVRSGMSRLETVRVTQSSAEQRRGRAGRLGPGICYRLWTATETAGLLEHATPEILETDMAPLALELAAWGTADATELAWLDAPPAAGLAAARELLRELGALETDGTITTHGRRMNELPLHPRLAHMVLRGISLGAARTACDLAALLSERDVLRGSPDDVDIRTRLDALGGRETANGAIDRSAVRHVRVVAERLRRSVGATGRADAAEAAGTLLALAYPDRIGVARDNRPGSFLLRNGRGARVPRTSLLSAVSTIVVADLDGRGDEARAFLAAPLDRQDLEHHFAEQITEETTIAWDDDTGGVRARTVSRLGAIVLGERTLHDPPPEAIQSALVAWIRDQGLEVLPWSRGANDLRARLAFVHHHDQRWPDVSDALLLAKLEEWLGPALRNVRRRAELARTDLHGALLGLLDWKQRAELDELAPSHMTVPSGSRIPIDYADPDSPVLAARLQELFGMLESPRVLRGTVALTVHLLSPAGRPAQVTRDLASFWRKGYFDVRKELKGRYPKHFWPEDPLTAVATRRARPAGH